MIKINQDDLIPILRQTGIKVKEYANPRTVGSPIEFFLTTEQGGTGLLVKKGEKICIEVATDNTHHQAVLAIKEGKRKIGREVTFSIRKSRAEYLIENFSLNRTLETLAKDKFNMVIPGSRITVSGINKVKETKDGLLWYKAKVTASVTKVITNNFLVGLDETSHFISVLPKKVNSVKEAHKLLRPKGLPINVKRQGEFFFVPVKTIPTGKIRRAVPLEKGSNHLAQFAIPKNYPKSGSWGGGVRKSLYKGVVYVKGLIYDRRAYRHAPVNLGDVWHKVVRNNEVKIKVKPSSRMRYD